MAFPLKSASAGTPTYPSEDFFPPLPVLKGFSPPAPGPPTRRITLPCHVSRRSDLDRPMCPLDGDEGGCDPIFPRSLPPISPPYLTHVSADFYAQRIMPPIELSLAHRPSLAVRYREMLFFFSCNPLSAQEISSPPFRRESDLRSPFFCKC